MPSLCELCVELTDLGLIDLPEFSSEPPLAHARGYTNLIKGAARLRPYVLAVTRRGSW